MTAKNFIIPGSKYNRLTYLSDAGKIGGGRAGLFRCDCGVEKVMNFQNVRRGLSKSCGCLKTAEWLRSVFEFGQRFGRLVYVGEAEKRGKDRRIVARCDCGTVREFIAHTLVSSNTQSCGCLWREIHIAASRARSTTHGMTHTRTFKSWESAIQRCHNPRDDHYPGYGGRGISVCDEWRDSFETFYRDMGERPQGTTLDRVDVNLGYSKGNCRWATNVEQSNNKRTTRYVTREGRRQSMTLWARELGIDVSRVYARAAAGWPEERWFEPSRRSKKA